MLSLLLWHAARTKLLTKIENEIKWQHRASPSAGGKHPIDIFIINDHDEDYSPISFYDPFAHTLCLLNHSKIMLKRFIKTVNNIVPIGNATIVWFAANFSRTISKYKNGKSLVWRDAGALLTTIAFVAEALQLNCCPIGITGENWISAMISSNNKVVGTGGCLVGVKPH